MDQVSEQAISEQAAAANDARGASLLQPEIQDSGRNAVFTALVKGDTDPASAGKAIEVVAEELRSSGRNYYP